MLRQKKPSSAQLKETSRRMKDATIGTHVSRISSQAQKQGVRFAKGRKVRSSRDEIKQVLPSTTTRESHKAYTQRMTQHDFIKRSVKEGRKWKLGILCVGLALALLVSVIAGFLVYAHSLDTTLSIRDDKLDSILAQADKAYPSYQVVCLTHDEGAQLSSVLIVRTNPDKAELSSLLLPGDMQVEDFDPRVHSLSEAYVTGSESMLISAINKVLDIHIAHIAVIDDSAVAVFVDALGGIEVDLPQEVLLSKDHSDALGPGVVHLSGKRAQVFCESADAPLDPLGTRAYNRTLVMRSVAAKLAQVSFFDYFKLLDRLSHQVKTDLSAMESFQLLTKLKACFVRPFYASALPGSETMGVYGSLYIPDSKKFSAILSDFTSGSDPSSDPLAPTTAVNPASFTLALNNGGTIEGAAAEATKKLTELGFKVIKTGNADQAVYKETLVVYSKADDEAKADAVIAALGGGRAVLDPVNYHFDADIVVMIGDDWNSIAQAPKTESAHDASKQ